MVGADELLEQQGGRADFAARVLDGRGGRVFGGGRGRQLGEVDGLGVLAGAQSGVGGWTGYGEDPPAVLELVQHNARLVRVDRVDGVAVGEGAAPVSIANRVPVGQRTHRAKPTMPCASPTWRSFSFSSSRSRVSACVFALLSLARACAALA